MNDLNKLFLVMTIILMSYYVLSSLNINLSDILGCNGCCNGECKCKKNKENFNNNLIVNDIPKVENKENIIKYKNIEKFNEEVKINGTDLLLSPLIEKVYNQNSVSNVNRNTSNDIRGDIPINYSTNYTPFYSN